MTPTPTPTIHTFYFTGTEGTGEPSARLCTAAPNSIYSHTTYNNLALNNTVYSDSQLSNVFNGKGQYYGVSGTWNAIADRKFRINEWGQILDISPYDAKIGPLLLLLFRLCFFFHGEIEENCNALLRW